MTDCFSFMSANGMGWMMWGAGLSWLLLLVLLVLTVAAQIKYRRTGGNDEPAGSDPALDRGETS